MTRARTRRRIPLWIAYLTVGAVGGLAYYFVHPVAKSGPFFNLLGLSSVAAISLTLRRNRPEQQVPWVMFAVGQALFIVGDVIAHNYPKLFGGSIPFPSISDLFKLGAYPCLIAGMLTMIRRRGPSRDKDSLIDSLIVTIGVGVLSWVLLMAPYTHDHTSSLLVKLTSIAYPLMDILLLAVTVRLAVGAGRRDTAFRLITVGVMVLLATDAAFGLLQLSGVEYRSGGVLEAGWLAFYLLWGAAALHPSSRSLVERARGQRTRFSRARLVLLATASLMAPLVEAIQALRGASLEVPVVVVGSMALFVLAMARMSGLVRRHEQAEQREYTLRQAGASLVTATTQEELFQAAVESGRQLVGPGPAIALHLRSEGDRHRYVAVASSGIEDSGRPAEMDLRRLPSEVVERMSAGHTAHLPGSDWSGFHTVSGAEARDLLLSPLFVRDELTGILSMSSADSLSPSVRDGVEALSSQLALALESAILIEEVHRQQSEARFAALARNSSDVMTVIHADSTIAWQSPSVHRVMGYEPRELVGHRLADFLVHPDDAPRLLALLSEIATEDSRPHSLEFRWRHRDGSWLHVETLWTDLTLDPDVGGIVMNTRDVSERKAFEQQLAHQAFHDSITGLANRALFRDRVEHALARQQRDDHSVAVLFMDIDDFKTVNDSLGHAAGDQLLAMVGERIKASLRAVDTPARLGGDEFAVLLEDASHERAAEVAERILGAFEKPLALEGKDVFVRVTIGIAIGDDDRGGPGGAEDLLRDADVAMYAAKSRGKGRYQVFEPEMHEVVLRRLELKADLQRAVENQEFVVHYQPVFRLDDNSVSGMEALVRWQHPHRGLLLPGEFIPLAEETGLVIPIGRWVLREACRQAVYLQTRFPSDPPLSMSVNLSARQLHHADLVDEVRSALEESGLEPNSLVLEITESVMINDFDAATLRLDQLKALGVRLAVDDFGTGYSSLNYLRQFPVDVLKIDRTFISGMAQGGEEAALTAAIIDLAGTLHLMPVAEGIEELGQLEQLRHLRCELGQGFLLARPVALRELEELLSSLRLQEDRVPVPVGASPDPRHA